MSHSFAFRSNFLCIFWVTCRSPCSADQERIGTCKDELLSMLDEDELKEAALCVFANKQDMPGALTPAQVRKHAGLRF